MPNRLANETSPYLLQHAHNPVDWYPWGPEALERARLEDRPILLSIGYSACHWCHVMERESFDDPETAGRMNDAFVCIKVDREERPDVDGLYMRAVQALTGRGGWPLTAFLTPEGEPFYGGTYFPPEPRHGMPAFRQVLDAVAGAWRNRREEVLENAAGLADMLRRAAIETVPAEEGAGDPPADGALTDGAFRALARRFDPDHGGFGSAPKFPQPTTLEFLLAHGAAADEPAAVEMVVATLHGMARGGLRDHLAGGFHRYSVDARWRVPHFEKMLYDNALLARLYLDAWRATGDEALRAVCVETLDHLLVDLRAPEGGFRAARDADSEGEEGRYYVWTVDQVEAAARRAGLPATDAELFCRIYDVVPGGNWEGRSILHLPDGLEAAARREGRTVAELVSALEPVRRALLDARARREPPLLDAKVLCSWSAFAVRALAEAGGALGRADHLDAARAGAAFLLGPMRPDGELRHVWTDGRLGVAAFLDDRAALANACLSLHEATLEGRWLDEALGLVDEVVALHFDEAEGLFYDDAPGAERLVARPREVMDQATPSGTALAVEALYRAAHLTDERRWAEVADRALDRERHAMARMPAGFGRLLTQVVRRGAEPVEVAVFGAHGDPRTAALVTAALEPYHAARVVTGGDPGAGGVRDLPLMAGRGTVDGTPAAWVCRGYVCERPEVDAEAVRRLVAGGSVPG